MVLRKTPLSLQVRRSAEAVQCGSQILDYLQSQRGALAAAAKEGRAPVAAVSEALQSRFPDAVKAMAVRQFVGVAVKSILQEQGFEVAQSGVRVPRDPVFRTASLYRMRLAPSAKSGEGRVEDVLGRLVEGLRPQERRALIRILRRSLGERADD